MLSRRVASSSNSSVCGLDADFEIAEGEIIEYNEELDCETATIDIGNPFVCSSPLSSMFETSRISSGPFASERNSFDLKGKSKVVSGLAAQAAGLSASSSYADRDQYHPESARQEIVEHIMMRREGMTGCISAKTLQHSSEQWNNYGDVCRDVAEALKMRGFPNALVQSIRYGSERHIVYEL
jgi:hypothetical protein